MPNGAPPRSRPLRALLVRACSVVAMAGIAALVASSCAGEGIVQGREPNGPRVLEHLPATTPGWVSASADPDADGWHELAASLGVGGDSEDVERLLASGVALALATSEDGVVWADDVDPWIGERFGLALTTGDVDAAQAVVGWAEVADQDALEQVLEERGWRRAGSDAATDGIQPWLAPTTATGKLPAIGIGDDLLLAARDGDSLSAVVDSAERRSARAEVLPIGDLVGSAKNDPVSVFVRGGALRETLVIRAGANPASLQTMRTIMGTPWIIAAKGAMFDLTASGERLRIDGRALYRGLDLGQRLLDPVDPDVLGSLPGDTAAAGAAEDPGVLLDGVFTTMQRGGSEYVTELDRGEDGEDEVSLEDVLDSIDGDGAVGVATDGSVHAVVEDDPENGPDTVPPRVVARLTTLVEQLAAPFERTADVQHTDGTTTVDVSPPAQVEGIPMGGSPTDPKARRAASDDGMPEPVERRDPTETTLADDPEWAAAWEELAVPGSAVGLGWLARDAWRGCGGPVPDLVVPWFDGALPLWQRVDGPVASAITWSEDDGQLGFAAEVPIGEGGCSAVP